MHSVAVGPARRKVLRTRRGRARFALVEILTLVLTLLILMAAALPFYLDSLTDSDIAICRTNMRILARLERSYKRRSPSHRYTCDLSELIRSGDIVYVPLCPAGGRYRILLGPATTVDGKRIAVGGFAVEDTVVPGHGSYVPGRDRW